MFRLSASGPQPETYRRWRKATIRVLRVFSIVYGVLLRPLPYQNANRLLRLSEFHPGATSAVSRPLLTTFTIHAWRGGKTIEDLAVFQSQTFSETSGAEPVKIAGASMSPAGFRLLGVEAIAGRLPVEADDAENAPNVAVIKEGFTPQQAAEEGTIAARSFELPSESAPGGKISARATAYVVTTGFAEALSLRLKKGRLFGADDMSASYETSARSDTGSRGFWLRLSTKGF